MMNPTSILIAGIAALMLILLMGILARMYRKAGPNEALIVYGFRGPRVIKGHGTVIFPDGGKLPRAVSGTDELRCRSAAGSLHQAGRGRNRGSRGPDQGAQRPGIDSHRGRAVSHQAAAAARRPDPPGHGRPPARHHRPVDRGADREGAGDGGRPHARHLRRRHEQDGSRGHFLHHQGSARQERVHLQHGPAGYCPHQARRGNGHRRRRARHRHQACDGTARVRRSQGAWPTRNG